MSSPYGRPVAKSEAVVSAELGNGRPTLQPHCGSRGGPGHRRAVEGDEHKARVALGQPQQLPPRAARQRVAPDVQLLQCQCQASPSPSPPPAVALRPWPKFMYLRFKIYGPALQASRGCKTTDSHVVCVRVDVCMRAFVRACVRTCTHICVLCVLACMRESGWENAYGSALGVAWEDG